MSNTPFLDAVRRVSEAATSSVPTEAALSEILILIADESVRREFFAELSSPHWLHLLTQHGYFSNPPSAERSSDGLVRCNHWPESGYLARMAPLVPHDVVPILSSIKTDNWLVVRDIIRAAQAMPANYAARLSPTIGRHVEEVSYSLELIDIGQLIASLAKGGEIQAAFDLLRHIFGNIRSWTAEGSRRDDFAYFKALEESAIPAIIPVKTLETLQLLREWMNEAMESEQIQRRGGDDGSYLWRPAIEEHGQNDDYRFATKFVSVLRAAFELAVGGGHITLTSALALLSDHGGTLFKRLRLHLIAEFADRDVELARQTMMDQANFTLYPLKHECARLMGKRFDLLTEEEKAQWLAWVDAGPEPIEPDFNEGIDSEDLREKRCDYWKFQRLHWIADHLTGRHHEFYRKMFAEHGYPKLADLHIYTSSGAWGHRSAFTTDELRGMGFEAAIDAVARWRPKSGQSTVEGPSLDGLIKVFQAFVAGDAVALSSKAALLQGQPAPYVRAFVRAMVASVKECKPIDLAAVLDLCDWVLNQPPRQKTAITEQGARFVDPDWQWTRDSIGELVLEVCDPQPGEVTPRFGLTHRDGLKLALSQLLDDPTKSSVVCKDAEDDPRVTDWPMLALNSPRGMAMRAVFAYAEWVVRHLVGDPDRPTRPLRGFDELPEVREWLERQLTRPDDYFTARAAFGWRFGLLHWIDAEWVREWVGKIFELRTLDTDKSKAFGWAAWNSYLLTHNPRLSYYELLRDQYGYAVDQAAGIEADQDSEERPFARLAEHVMLLYGRGNLGNTLDEALDRDNALIKRLVIKAHQSVRSHALRFVGRSLQEYSDALPDSVASRLTNLWEWYWKIIGESDAKENPASSVFGYWFCCKAFDPKWSLAQLERFVQVAPKAEPDGPIMERLVEICSLDPLRSARIVGQLVEGDTGHWRVHSWKDEAYKILDVAHKAGGEARAAAEQVIDRLGRLGYLEFGNLLEHGSTES